MVAICGVWASVLLAPWASADEAVTVKCEAYEHPDSDAAGEPMFLGVFYGTGVDYAEAMSIAEYGAFNGRPMLPQILSCEEETEASD